MPIQHGKRQPPLVSISAVVSAGDNVGRGVAVGAATNGVRVGGTVGAVAVTVRAAVAVISGEGCAVQAESNRAVPKSKLKTLVEKFIVTLPGTVLLRDS